jgi:hypothetical protein
MRTDTVDALVSTAKRLASAEAYDDLFDALKGVEIFFNVTPAVGTGSVPSVSLHRVGPLSNAVMFFTSKTNKNLVAPYAGIPWERALEMAAKMPQADGVVLLMPTTIGLGSQGWKS